MQITTRLATPADAEALVAIVNEIIRAGGTTAHQTPFDTRRMTCHYISPDRGVTCVVAETDGTALGFQSLVWPDEEGDVFPEGWAIIASFVAPDAAGRGVGRALFAATRAAAEAAGVTAIDATIRADNTVGLSFYDRLGFVDYDVLPAVSLRDGTRVDRIRKMFSL